ncbi:MAG: hypothetical protein HC905_28170 [Bacteroidales bacterium]|nr:hypothetical protein [Bacteroidales bacterium]
MPEDAYKNGLLSNLVLKIKLRNGQHISSAFIGNEMISSYYEDAGFGFIVLPLLKREKYLLRYEIGKNEMPLYVLGNGSFNVYETKLNSDTLFIKLRMYGTQDLVVMDSMKYSYCISDNPNLKINHFKYFNNQNRINITAHDIQGETGTIRIIRKP